VQPVRPGIPCDIAVSLGTGGNEAKQLGGEFERRLMEMLDGTERQVLVDKGGDPEEAARVQRAVAGLGNVRTWQGDFATFASSIAGSRLYVGYDSAGQHVAAAAGVPLVAVFAGAVSERFFARWRPAGEVVRADKAPLENVLARCGELVRRVWQG
jgi:ADP-heptose:LPS heptosyltransferase